MLQPLSISIKMYIKTVQIHPVRCGKVLSIDFIKLIQLSHRVYKHN